MFRLTLLGVWVQVPLISASQPNLLVIFSQNSHPRKLELDQEKGHVLQLHIHKCMHAGTH